MWPLYYTWSVEVIHLANWNTVKILLLYPISFQDTVEIQEAIIVTGMSDEEEGKVQNHLLLDDQNG